MKKVIGILFFLFIVGSSAGAHVPDKKIAVRSGAGVKEIAVREIGSIRFRGEEMLLNLKDGSAMSWIVDDVDVMTFLYTDPSDETGIGVCTAGDFTVSGGVLTIKGNGTLPVQLSTMDGKLLFGGSCNGSLHLPLGEYPAGVYLLNVNGTIHKIMNR